MQTASLQKMRIAFKHNQDTTDRLVLPQIYAKAYL